jgi:site-specific recombinase XerD
MVLETYTDEYHKYLKETGYSPGTIRYSIYSVRMFIEFVNEKDNAGYGDITKDYLNGFKRWIMERTEIKEISADTVRKRAHRFLAWLSLHKGISNSGLRSCGREPMDDARLLNEYPEDFIKYHNEYICKKKAEKCPIDTLKRLKHNIRQFYHYLFNERGVKKLSEVKRTDVREFAKYLTGLIDEKGKSRYLPVTVNNRISDIKTWMRWLSKKGVCAGLSGSLKMLRGENHLSRNILTRKELVRLFSVKAENYREFMQKTLIVLLYASGIRVGEALEMKTGDIDFEKKEALIYESKTRKERIVQLGEVCTAYLRLYLAEIRDNVGYCGTNSDKVFVSVFEGKELKKDCINHTLKKFCRLADIKKAVTCHCFRHSFGTHLFENGAGIKQVCDLIGHSSISNTQRYTQLNPEHLRKTIMKYHPIEKESPFNKFKDLSFSEGELHE